MSESFDMWCFRRMVGIIWANQAINEDILHGVEKERIVPHAIKRRKANWIGHILRRNCLLKYVIKGKIEGTGRQGRRCKNSWKAIGKRKDIEILKRKN